MRIVFGLMATGVMAAVTAGVQAQDMSRGVRIQGEISSDHALTGILTVELSAASGGMPETAQVNSDGTFQFEAASPGMRQLQIEGSGGKVIYQEFVQITGPTQRLSIRLPDSPSANRAAGNTISLQQLQHKVPPSAKKAFDKGLNAERKRKWEEAATLFSKAIEEDPEFADAHNELGAVEVSLGRLPQAAAQFQKAIDVAPEHRLALPNLSIVLAKMKQYREAGEVARRALRVMPQVTELRYILGLSLVVEHGDQTEALANLKQAESSFPKAHLLEAQLLADSGRKEEAARHLEEYLRAGSPDDQQRSKIEADLAGLRHSADSKE